MDENTEEINDELENVFDQLNTETQGTPTIPEVLNLLPLRDAVIFPVLVAPIVVGREPYMRLISDSVRDGSRLIGIVTQRDPGTERPTPADVYPTGVVVTIRMMNRGRDTTQLLVQGIQRFHIQEILQEEPYMRARIKVCDEPAELTEEENLEVEALRRELAGTFTRIVELSNDMPDHFKEIEQVTPVGTMTDMIAAHAHLNTAEKAQILETLPLVERMRALHAMLLREAQIMELGASIHNQAAGEMSKAQREYYLREQLKVIHKELGEGDERGRDVEELRERLDAAQLPADARKEADRELERMSRMAFGAPEYTVARTYLDLMASLPWAKATEDNLDIPHVKEVLDDDHYGLDKIKDRLLEFLAVRKIKLERGEPVRQPILCFVGPPGVGKTSLGRSIARAMGREFYRLSLGGVRDEAEIRGHRRTYIGAMAGQIVTGLKRAGTNNPVFLLDEIDKLAHDHRGDPSSALLEALDPEQNTTFRDNYLDTPFDLSNVLFITTANGLDTIQGPLRDRMEIIELTGYTEQEKVAIARQHLVPKQLGEHGLTVEQVTVTDDALYALVQGHTREAGVRSLERQVAAVCRKATRSFAEGRTEPLVVTRATVEEYLGAPRFEFEELDDRTSIPGVATGLVWTPVGGDVIFIEAQKMEGSKTLQLTGQLGDVMQESAKAALSYIRANATELGVPANFWNETELHIHVPAGATPKDGPSAGVTMTTVMTSLLTGRRVKPRLAMTGEVTLTGRVLPVGGIKEKVLAAKRSGVTTVILPARNRKDLEEDIPAELRQGMTFHFAESVRDVIELALEPTNKARRIRVKASPEKPTAKPVPVPTAPLPEPLQQPSVPPARA
jgi:ATP-dependent Lon protease